MGNFKISTNCESPGIGGDSACPSRTAPELCDGVVLHSLELSNPEGMPQRWGRSTAEASDERDNYVLEDYSQKILRKN